jgi:acetoin:2,6-dichlorophenolindophenol oxidoreductase subunit alpha
MREPQAGVITGLAEKYSKEENLGLWEAMCKIRAFEYNAADVFDSEFQKMPIYLGVGSESVAAALNVSYGDTRPDIFTQHRGHGYYIAFGGNLESLIDELLHRPSGCAEGMGGSASIHSPEIKMWGHDGFMGTEVPFGIGRMLGANYGIENEKDKKHGLVVMGDASVEEGYVLGSLGVAAHSRNNLPILFICEDNNLSVLTERKVRREWDVKNVAEAFGLRAYDFADDPWTIMHYVKEEGGKLPALMNIQVARVLRHVGSKSDGKPEWNRFDLTRKELERIGLKDQVKDVERRTKDYVDGLWKRKLEAY